jgi:hypothetical protein
MRQSSYMGAWLMQLAAVVLPLAGRPVLAEDKDLVAPVLRLNLEQSVRSLGDFAAVRSYVPLSLTRNQALPRGAPSGKSRLDASPLFDDFVSTMRSAGFPLRAIADKTGERTIGVSASFNIGERLPAVAFRAGKSLPDAVGAVSSARSVSWALTWPVHQFTLRFEGGSRSDFGSFAIAGAQWSDPSRPLAIGIGIPLKPQNAHGSVGVLLQMRVKW